MLARPDFCPNQNHKRRNAPVRYCPQCGDVVNEDVTKLRCNDTRHAELRRQQSLFCIDCGEALRRAAH
jgi:hypothetical protein